MSLYFQGDLENLLWPSISEIAYSLSRNRWPKPGLGERPELHLKTCKESLEVDIHFLFHSNAIISCTTACTGTKVNNDSSIMLCKLLSTLTTKWSLLTCQVNRASKDCGYNSAYACTFSDYEDALAYPLKALYLEPVFLQRQNHCKILGYFSNSLVICNFNGGH